MEAFKEALVQLVVVNNLADSFVDSPELHALLVTVN